MKFDTKPAKLKEWIITEKQARKESNTLCTVLQELEMLVENRGKLSAGERAYSCCIRLINAKFPIPSVHTYVDRVSLVFNEAVSLEVKVKCLEISYTVSGVVRYETLEEVLADPKFLDAIDSKTCERLSDTGYERLQSLIDEYIYKGQLFQCSTGKLFINLDKDQLDTETFDNLLMVLAEIYVKYPDGMQIINGSIATPSEMLIWTKAPPCYYFYNGIISFSVEIENGMVHFKDYQGALPLTQTQICDYYPKMLAMLKQAL